MAATNTNSARQTAPEPGAGARRTRRTEVVVLSSDDGFLIELGPVLGDRFRTRPVDSPAELPEPDASNWFAIIDASTRDRARALVAQIEQRYPNVPLVVVHGERGIEEWHQAQQRGHVCALVGRGQVAGEQMNNALRTALQRLESGPAVTPARAGAARGGAGAGIAAPLLRYALIALALAASGAAAWWWLARSPSAVPAAPVARPPASAQVPPATARSSAPDQQPASAIAQRTVEQLLSAARIAFADQKNLLPKGAFTPGGDSALELYASVLEQAPDNEEAREGMNRLFSVARSRIQADLAAGKLDEAQRMLELFGDVGLPADALKPLEADIAAAKPRWFLAQARAAAQAGDLDNAEQLLGQAGDGGADRADRAAVRDVRRLIDAGRADQRVNDLATQVRASVTAGNLLDPANDNAVTRFAQLRQQARASTVTAAVQKELQSALLDKAQAAVRAQQAEVAQRYITAAADFGNNSDLADARKGLQTLTDQQAARARQAEAARQAAAVASSKASTPAEQSCLNPRPTRELGVQYPTAAKASGTAGYVIVKFMLSAKGRTSDVSVESAEPAGVFDQAAMNAVAHGRFDSTGIEDGGEPRCARIRLSFRPN